MTQPGRTGYQIALTALAEGFLQNNPQDGEAKAIEAATEWMQKIGEALRGLDTYRFWNAFWDFQHGELEMSPIEALYHALKGCHLGSIPEPDRISPGWEWLSFLPANIMADADSAEHSLENEQQRLQAEANRAEHFAALQTLRQQLRSDYPGADKFFRKKLESLLSEQDFIDERIQFVQDWITEQGFSSRQPDPEQAAAIGNLDQYILLRARAGSGKTTTLVNRALFLIKHCGIQPNELMLLAFNRAAAQEIRERLAAAMPGTIPHVMTFHALAYALVHPEEALLFDDPEGAAQKTQCLQLVIDDFKRDPLYRIRIQALMLAHFRGEWEQETRGGWDKPPEEALHHRRTRVLWESIQGKPVKSFGEKLIADFLFEHNIAHWYEPNRYWGGMNYRPDFILPSGKNQGIVIEYFGLAGDPAYDEMISAKRGYWATQPGFRLLELFPSDFNKRGGSGFLQKLKLSLEPLGVACVRLSEEEIWTRIQRRALNRFDRIVTALVGRFRKLGLNPDQAETFVTAQEQERTFDPLEAEFLHLGIHFYRAYLHRMKASGEDDFDGLMVRAAERVSSGATWFKRRSGGGDLRNLRHLLIDEYQDFSELFHGLVAAIRHHVPELNIFCVGDDWQAINGFAGSDLRFFRSFKTYFPGATQLSLRTNYRSAQAIVRLGNQVMKGLGIPAVAERATAGEVWLADLAKFYATDGEQERYPMETILPVAIRLAWDAIRSGQKLVFLNRTNTSAYFTAREGLEDEADPRSLTGFLERVRAALPEEHRAWITISTTHQYKGKEQEVVAVLDALNRRYPLIHPDYRFFQVFGESEESLVEEERRLFYVAVTRAKDKLVLITEKERVSPFLSRILGATSNLPELPWVEWERLKPPEGAVDNSRLQIRVQQQRYRPPGSWHDWGTRSIKEFLKADNFKGRPINGEWVWSQTTTRQNLNLPALKKRIWSQQGRGLAVCICTLDEKVLAEFWVDQGHWAVQFDELGLSSNDCT